MAIGSEMIMIEKTVVQVSGHALIPSNPSGIPEPRMFLTVDEAADLLRTSRKAVYAMIARGQLPGVTRLRRRLLIRSADLLDWLRQKSAPSPER
jgi:excisionase family DNA binding protein